MDAKKDPTHWHVSYRGPEGSDFEKGVYHFSLKLHEYPKNGPVTAALNENGAYNVGDEICLVGITHYHTEAWSPGTTIDAVITALQCYMVATDRSGYGFISPLDKVRIKAGAEKSKSFVCPICKADHSKDFK